MRRRDVIALLGGAAAMTPALVRAQQPATPIVGFLGTASAAPYQHYLTGLIDGLKSTGRTVGQNVLIEYRWAEGRNERLSALAAELVDRRVSVIVTAGGNAPAQAAKTATGSIPIVLISGGDPVKGGLVAHLNRPDGNVTGVTMIFSTIIAKRLELLHKLVGGDATIGVLINPNYPEVDSQRRETENAATSIGAKIQIVSAGNPGEIDSAFAIFREHGVRALFVANDPYFNGRRDQIIALAARQAMPATYDNRAFPAAGGLMSYGSNIHDAFRQAGIYAGKLLNGALVIDLPVMQAAKFELVINLKTAKTLGLDMPPTFLALADEVIE